MSSTISDIRRNLQEQIALINGLKVTLVPPADSVGNELPVATINLLNASYALTYGGKSLGGEIIITIYVQSGENDEGWQQLDEYLSAEGDNSIVRAIEDDTTAGLPDVTFAVMGFQNAGFQNILGGVWSAEILVNYAKRS